MRSIILVFNLNEKATSTNRSIFLQAPTKNKISNELANFNDTRYHPVTHGLSVGIFEVDIERQSVSDRLHRPLMFCNNDELMSLASSDLQAVEVIDPSFICFTSLWGIALPGAVRWQRWSWDI
jgi:hypothetical protein